MNFFKKIYYILIGFFIFLKQLIFNQNTIERLKRLAQSFLTYVYRFENLGSQYHNQHISQSKYYQKVQSTMNSLKDIKDNSINKLKNTSENQEKEKSDETMVNNSLQQDNEKKSKASTLKKEVSKEVSMDKSKLVEKDKTNPEKNKENIKNT